MILPPLLPPLSIQVKGIVVHTSSLDPSHARSQAGDQNRPVPVLCFVQSRLVLLSREPGSLTKVASFCKVECHRKDGDCDCCGECPGCLSASGQRTRLRVQQPGVLELPPIVFTQSLVMQTCRQPSAEKWIFLWFISNRVALERMVLFMREILFFKARGGVEDKRVPLALLSSCLYLHILKRACVPCLSAHIYLSPCPEWKGEANLYTHFTPAVDCRDLGLLKKASLLL